MERRVRDGLAQLEEAIAMGPPEVPEEFRSQVEGPPRETSRAFQQTIDAGPPPMPEHVRRLIEGPPPPVPPDMAEALSRAYEARASEPPAEVADQIEASGR